MPPELRAQIDAWAACQDDTPSLSGAIRRLVERQLATESAARPRSAAKRAKKPNVD